MTNNFTPTNSINNKLTFGEYDEYMVSLQSSFPGKEEDRLNLFAFGIAEEAGEVLGKLKRNLREGGVTTQDIVQELGDLLGYMSCLANEIGSNLTEVANRNISKMEIRKSKKTLIGSGDNR